MNDSSSLRVDDHDWLRGRLCARLLQAPDAPDEEAFPRASVLVPLLMHQRPTLFYTQRAPWLTRHAGQVAFPGGRLEKNEDFAQAALREAHEEVGLDPVSVDILGYLPSLISISDFRVVPVVAFVDPLFEPKLDYLEVASCFEVPLHTLCHRDVFSLDERVHNGILRRTSSFYHEGIHIWGMTGLLTHDLMRVLAGERVERWSAL